MPRPRLDQLATEATFHEAYSRQRAGRQWDRELLSFHAAGELYGIEIRWMREIVRVPPITSVPRVPAFVRGICTVRGEVVPVLDFRLRLRLRADPLTARSRILICEVDGERYGLLVDSVRSVVRLRDEEIEPPPPSRGPAADFLSGIGRADGQMIILLDLPAVVAFSVAEGAR